MEQKPFGVSVGRTTKKVYTIKGIQHHHGYKGFIRLRGEREPIACCSFHQKPKAARAHAEKVARQLVKERGL